MSRTKRKMQRLLDRYTNLQIDFEEWLGRAISFERDVSDGEWSDKGLCKNGEIRQIVFKRKFKIGKHFVVDRLEYVDEFKKFCVIGGVLRETTETIPIDRLTLTEMNSLARELDERGYFDE